MKFSFCLKIKKAEKTIKQFTFKNYIGSVYHHKILMLRQEQNDLCVFGLYGNKETSSVLFADFNNKHAKLVDLQTGQTAIIYESDWNVCGLYDIGENTGMILLEKNECL